MNVYRILERLLLNGAMLFATGVLAGGLPATVTRVVDGAADVPGWVDDPYGDNPTLLTVLGMDRAGNIGFTVTGTPNGLYIYRSNSDDVVRVVEFGRPTTVQGVTLTAGYTVPVFADGQVAFLGRGSDPDEWLLVKGSSAADLTIVASTYDIMPDLGYPYRLIDQEDAGAGNVAWRGNGNSTPRGIFTDLGGVPRLVRQADSASGFPQRPLLDGTVIGYTLTWGGGVYPPPVPADYPGGYYWELIVDGGDGPRKMATRYQKWPEGTGAPSEYLTLNDFGRTGTVMAGGQFAFLGGYYTPGPGSVSGIFSTAGGLHTVVDGEMRAPGSANRFSYYFSSSSFSLSDGRVAFVANPRTEASDVFVETSCSLRRLGTSSRQIQRRSLQGRSVALGAASVIERVDFGVPGDAACAGRQFALIPGTSAGMQLGRLHRNEAQVAVERRGTSTGASLGDRNFFDPGTIQAKQVIRLPDIGGGPADDLAVVGVRISDKAILVEVRDADTGERIRATTVFAGGQPGYTPQWLFHVPDADGDGKADLGVLVNRHNDDAWLVAVIGAVSGTRLGTLNVTSGLDAVMAVGLPDLDSDGIPEVAVLAWSGARRRAIAEISNATSASPARTMEFVSGWVPLDMQLTPDTDGDGAPELAILAERIADRASRIELQNAIGSPNRRTRMFFSTGYQALDFTGVPDTDGDGVAEWAVLARRMSDGRAFVKVGNAAGVPNFSRVPFLSTQYLGLTVEVMDDKANDGIADIGVIGRRETDNRLRVEIRNARGSLTPRAFPLAP